MSVPKGWLLAQLAHQSLDVLYEIAFVEDNESAMQREIEWYKGKPLEGWNTRRQAMVAFSRGELKKSRQLFERARAIALQGGLREQAAGFTEDQAQYEAELGNRREASAAADLALRLMPNSADHKASAALVFARAANLRRADKL